MTTFTARLAAAALAAAPMAAAGLPPGFTLDTVASNLGFPTSLSIATNGDLYVFTISGELFQVDPATGAVDSLGTVPVSTGGCEQGGLGIALSPDFAESSAVYLSYTSPDRRGTVARYVIAGGAIDLDSREVVWENPTVTNGCHNAGGIAFGTDGSLFVTTGDLQNSSNSRDITLFNGKLLRMTADGDPAPGNPFPGQGGAAPFVWAYGLRNPYRISIDPLNGNVWIGDVGAVLFEEVNFGVAGGDYGWSLMEGTHCNVADCSQFVAPVLAYSRNDPEYDGGATVTMGPVYRGVGFPPAYRGNVFYADFIADWVRRMVVTETGELVEDSEFLPEVPGGAVTDLKVGPDGALYVLSGSGAVHRIRGCGPDADGDGLVGSPDLAALLGAWGETASPFDLTGDGFVGAQDLAALLGGWGACGS